MSFNYEDYCQYLLSSQTNYTLTHLAEHLQKFSHDTINRYLRNEQLTPSLLWQNIKLALKEFEDGKIVFDDTVLDKRYGQSIELVRRQYSGTEHRVLPGIGLINCLYINRKLDRFWVVNYRIYEREKDGKSKLDYVADMLNNLVNSKQLSFARVLMDSWYACQKLMFLIENLGKIYYCPLKKNRLVDDTGGIEKYKSLEKMEGKESEIEQGKLIKIKGLTRDKKVELFRVTVSANRTEYVVTNDLNQNSITAIKRVCKERGKIDEFHRELKQLTGVESCQCRHAQIQRNHIACAILVWSFLKKTAYFIGKTVDQLKHELLSEYLKKEVRYPHLTRLGG
jgi:hypothetical protein